MAECGLTSISCHVGELANSAFGGMVEGLYDGAVEMAKIIGTWWMEVPPPNLDSAGLSLLQQDLSWFAWVFAVIGFLVGLIRLVMTEDVRSGAVNLGKLIVNLVLATGVYMAAVPILLTAGDETARWLLDRSTEGNSSMEMLIPSTGAMAGNHGVAFVVYLLMLLGSIVNFMFMIFRNLMVVILMAFIALLAAASGTEAGNQAWRKANGWLIALLLFKPVAAGIYALGFRMMVDDTDLTQTSDLGAGLVSALTGLLVLVLAAFALPGLIKFIVPAAAAGSGGFSGGAALSGAAGVAAGAAVLAGGIGAGMAARGAGMSTAGAGSAGGGGAAATASGGSPSAGGMAASAASTGGTTAEGASATAGGSSGNAAGGGSAGAAGGSPAGGTTTDGGSTSASGSAPAASVTSGADGGTGQAASGAGSSSAGSAGQTAGAPATASPATGTAPGAPAASGATGQDGGTAQGGGRWAEAINRVTQAGQAGSQAAQGARVDRVLDDEGEQS